MKKTLWILLAVCLLAACFFGVKHLFFRNPAPAGPDASETPVSEAELSDSTGNAEPQAMTDEEYDAMIKQEIEELQEEEPLLDDQGQEVPSMDVSEDEEIIIGDTEGAGSL